MEVQAADHADPVAQHLARPDAYDLRRFIVQNAETLRLFSGR